MYKEDLKGIIFLVFDDFELFIGRLETCIFESIKSWMIEIRSKKFICTSDTMYILFAQYHFGSFLGRMKTDLYSCSTQAEWQTVKKAGYRSETASSLQCEATGKARGRVQGISLPSARLFPPLFLSFLS